MQTAGDAVHVEERDQREPEHLGEKRDVRLDVRRHDRDVMDAVRLLAHGRVIAEAAVLSRQENADGDRP